MQGQSSPLLTDQEIITGIKAGGLKRAKMENQLYRQFWHLIKKGAGKHAISEENAASAYSNTIIAVIKNIVLGTYEHRASLEKYIGGIFYNKCVDERRSDWNYAMQRRREEEVDELVNKLPDKTGTVINALIKKQEWSILSERIKTLGGKCYDILLLWGNHYADQEIADIMGYSTAQVARVTRVRCLEKIQKDIANRKAGHE